MQEKKNVILVDADYIDRVAFNLIVNFERMLERRIPQADLALWLDCVALDGGLRPADNLTQVVLLHSDKAFQNFLPASFSDELDGKAFSDNLGEFLISSVRVESITTMDALYRESLQHLAQQTDVERLMLVPGEQYLTVLGHELKSVEKPCCVFTMEPQVGRYEQQMLGFSLMKALGIRSDEIVK